VIWAFPFLTDGYRASTISTTSLRGTACPDLVSGKQYHMLSKVDCPGKIATLSLAMTFSNNIKVAHPIAEPCSLCHDSRLLIYFPKQLFEFFCFFAN